MHSLARWSSHIVEEHCRTVGPVMSRLTQNTSYPARAACVRLGADSTWKQESRSRHFCETSQP